MALPLFQYIGCLAIGRTQLPTRFRFERQWLYFHNIKRPFVLGSDKSLCLVMNHIRLVSPLGFQAAVQMWCHIYPLDGLFNLSLVQGAVALHRAKGPWPCTVPKGRGLAPYQGTVPCTVPKGRGLAPYQGTVALHRTKGPWPCTVPRGRGLAPPKPRSH
jgi:hypothetical protein